MEEGGGDIDLVLKLHADLLGKLAGTADQQKLLVPQISQQIRQPPHPGLHRIGPELRIESGE